MPHPEHKPCSDIEFILSMADLLIIKNPYPN